MPLLRVGDTTGWAEPTLPPLPSLHFLTLDEMLSQNTSYCENGIPKLVGASQLRKRAIAESFGLHVDDHIPGLSDTVEAPRKRARFKTSTPHSQTEDEAETKVMRHRVRAFLNRRDADEKESDTRRLELMRLSVATKKEAKKDRGVKMQIHQYLSTEHVSDENAKKQIRALAPSLTEKPLSTLASTSGTSSNRWRSGLQRLETEFGLPTMKPSGKIPFVGFSIYQPSPTALASPPPDKAELPTHALAITRDGSSFEEYPIHAIPFLSRCLKLQLIDESVDVQQQLASMGNRFENCAILPMVILQLPYPERFRLFHEYVYNDVQDAGGLVREFLPELPDQAIRGVLARYDIENTEIFSFDVPNADSVSGRKKSTSEREQKRKIIEDAQRQAEILVNEVGIQKIFLCYHRIYGFWCNMKTLGAQDDALLLNVVRLCYAIVLRAIMMSTEKTRASTNREMLASLTESKDDRR